MKPKDGRCNYAQCPGGIPQSCNLECAAVFLPLYSDCPDLLAMHPNLQPHWDALADTCEHAMANAIASNTDGSDDRALATARTLALFEATRGTEQRDAVLGMLLAVDIPTRNAAHAALVRLTGDAAGYDPLGLEKDRERSVRRYRELLAK